MTKTTKPTAKFYAARALKIAAARKANAGHSVRAQRAIAKLTRKLAGL